MDTEDTPRTQDHTLTAVMIGSGAILALLIASQFFPTTGDEPVVKPAEAVESGQAAQPDRYPEAMGDADHRIMDAEITDEVVNIRVASNGCTSEDDFRPLVLPEGNAVTVIFRREKLDPCRAIVPDGVVLTFTREEMGIAPDAEIVLMNPRYE